MSILSQIELVALNSKSKISNFTVIIDRICFLLSFVLFLLFFMSFYNFLSPGKINFISEKALFIFIAIIVFFIFMSKTGKNFFCRDNCFNTLEHDLIIDDELLSAIADSEQVDDHYKTMIAEELLKAGRVTVGRLFHLDKQKVVADIIEKESKKHGFSLMIKFNSQNREGGY